MIPGELSTPISARAGLGWAPGSNKGQRECRHILWTVIALHVPLFFRKNNARLHNCPRRQARNGPPVMARKCRVDGQARSRCSLTTRVGVFEPGAWDLQDRTWPPAARRCSSTNLGDGTALQYSAAGQ